MRFVISGRLPGMNELIHATNIHWAKGNQIKQRETRRCAESIIAGGIPHLENPIALSISWIEKDKRRDIDNIAAGVKFILDGLVLSNRIPFDTRRWVRGITHSFPEPDKKNPRVEVEITELEGE